MIDGAGGGDRAGRYVAVADVDDDGDDDILVSAIGHDDLTGAVYLVLSDGGAFPSSLADDTDTGSADTDQLVVFTGEYTGDLAGTALAVGDVSGDGQPKLLIGAYRYPGGNLRGAVYLFRGPAAASLSLSEADQFLLGGVEGDQFGAAVAVIGDVSVDGVNDLLIGAPGHDGETGKVYLLEGGDDLDIVQGDVDSAYATFVGSEKEQGLGQRVAALGDVDADGDEDFLIGNGASKGAWLVYGGGLGRGEYTIDTTPNAVFIEGEEGVLSGLASALAAAGDVDGDGRAADFLLGAYQAGEGGEDAGGACLFLATGAPLSGGLAAGDADVCFLGAQAGEEAGGVLAAGDLDGNGQSDVLIGASERDRDAGTAAAGGVYLVFGEGL